MKVTVSKFNIPSVSAESLVLGMFQGGAKKLPVYIREADKLTDGVIERFFTKNKGFGNLFEAAHFFISPKNHKSIEKVTIIGLGKVNDLDNARFRQIAGFVGKLNIKGTKSIAIYLPKEANVGKRAEILVIGFAAGIFDPGHHKTEKSQSEKIKVESLEMLADANIDAIKKGADLGLLIGTTLGKVREAINLPANIVTPEYMVKFAKKVAEDNKLKIEIFSEKQVNEMGMNIMASVAKGSEEDLYFVVMQYLPAGRQAKVPTLGLIGKGITFDSGGISIKPSESMEWMKMDMAGAAAVFGAMDVISKLKPKINVVCAVPLTENLPSGRASKPGDVVKGLLGKTVEIINTDAEGRLVLSDALTYVQKNFKPQYIVDVATLTGAAMVALGTSAAAILGRPQKFIEEVMRASESAGERVWQLPLYDEYREMLKSYIADIANVSAARWGGAETGAKFLEEFVDKKVAWVHLDIAPTAWEETDRPYASRGATGVMVTTLTNLALALSK